MWWWKQWPDEIESDLWIHCNQTDIGWWHQLTINPETNAPRLSSRRLLTLLEHLPEDSEFKTAAERGGRWPEWKTMLARSVNMQTHQLAWYLAMHSSGDVDLRFDPDPLLLIDPVDMARKQEQEQAEQEQAAQTEPELAEAGWM